MGYNTRMIGHLSGKVLAVKSRFLVLDVNGVGYKIFTTLDTLLLLKKGADSPLSLWTHTAVREDALDLYGFREEAELELFELLISVSGIGPRSALAILQVATLDILSKAIGSGDTSYLVKVSGIGKKTAEKIVLELRDKIGVLEENASAALGDEATALEALRSLGYSTTEAREALKTIPRTVNGTNDRIKEALKYLGK